MEWISLLSSLIGVEEDALRLLIGILLAYPIGYVYINSFLRSATPNIQHLYFTLTGILIAWWTIDLACVSHNCICIFITFVTLKLFGSSKYVIPFMFGFHLTYLNVGYIVNNSFGPTVSWTTPHCVLCLRLIGVACDVYDGSKENAKETNNEQIRKTIKRDQNNNDALKEVPSLLEMTSHVFYLPSYFVGPQHSMLKYQNFIQRNQEKSDMTGSLEFGKSRLFVGCLYLLLNVVGSLFLPVQYVTTNDFLKNNNFWKQSFYFIIWIKTIFAKYMGVWLLADGAVAITGLGYDGRERTEWNLKWDRVVNVKPLKYENCEKFTDLVDCFNITTNVWCKNYVYKRCLRAFNHKPLSHLITMGFLAIWHGLSSGYFLCFFFELFPITFEKEIIHILNTNPFIKKINERHSWLKEILKVLSKCYFLFFLPHCLTPFVLIRHELYLPVLWSTNFLVLAVFGGWFIVKGIICFLCSHKENIRIMEQFSAKKEI